MRQFHFQTTDTKTKTAQESRFKKTAHSSQLRTLLLVFLALLVAFGGWFLTKQFLHHQEARLLARSGQLHAAESGFSLRRQEDTPSGDAELSPASKQAGRTQDQNTQNKNQKSATTKSSGSTDPLYEISLSEDTTAQILRCWASGTSLLSRDPKKGELSMEQAIDAGACWIQEMSQAGFLPASLSKNSFRDVSAALYTLEEKSDLSEYLLSRWIICYTIGDLRITLSIHAATGQVWQAEITAKSDTLPEPLLTEEEALLKAAFPFLAGGTEFIEELANQTYHICVTSEKNKIVASVQRSLYENDETNNAMVTLMLRSRE